MVKFVSGYDLIHTRSRRASIVPYVVNKGKIRFLYGIDNLSGDITDLGGGVKKYECTLSAAIREFKEETKGVFGEKVYSSILQNAWRTLGLYTESMAVVYVRMEDERVDIVSNFKSVSSDEMRGLLWLSEPEFRSLILGRNSRRKMWGRVRNFYKGVDTNTLVTTLLGMEWLM